MELTFTELVRKLLEVVALLAFIGFAIALTWGPLLFIFYHLFCRKGQTRRNGRASVCSDQNETP